MRNTAINLRVRAEQRDLIDCAAHTLGKNRSDFMLEAACEKAQGVMLDQVFFSLDAKNFRPVEHNVALAHRLLGRFRGFGGLGDRLVTTCRAGVRLRRIVTPERRQRHDDQKPDEPARHPPCGRDCALASPLWPYAALAYWRTVCPACLPACLLCITALPSLSHPCPL